MAKAENLNVRVHGYVDATALESIMATADVIVSLKTSDQISAKIFECMSYGKPVVHYSGHLDDPNAYYLHKYASGHVVRMYAENQDAEISDLLQFLKNSIGKKVDSAELIREFEMSTPEYSAKKIIEMIERVENK